MSNLDLNYISVPVQYNVYLTRSKCLMIGAGGYASYLVSSKQTGGLLYEKMQTYDAGFMASGGVWINRHVLLQTGYQFGLVDMDGAESNKARNGRTLRCFVGKLGMPYFESMAYLFKG